jgi:hypothetical protein
MYVHTDSSVGVSQAEVIQHFIYGNMTLKLFLCLQNSKE